MSTFYFPKNNTTFVVPYNKLINMTLAFRKELQPFLVNKKPQLPYLEELLSLNDINVRKRKAYKILSKKYFLKDSWFETFDKRSGTTAISCVFGAFRGNWNTFLSQSLYKLWRSGKCGIEILGMKPNSTNHTYSKECYITIPKLKEACKMNGIKPKGSKVDLLHALMKV